MYILKCYLNENKILVKLSAYLLSFACKQVGNVNLHGPLVQGIAGNGEKAYSIVMSAGYEGDTDEGDRLFYSASGGRNLDSSKRTGAQVEDQSLLKGSSANRFVCSFAF